MYLHKCRTGFNSIDADRICTLHGRILALKQDQDHIHYKVTWPQKPLTPPMSEDLEKDDTEDLLRHYFSLEVDLKELYEYWSEVDANFRRRAPNFGGVRILNQDPWETLLAFICSSNNNIPRISQMVCSSLTLSPEFWLTNPRYTSYVNITAHCLVMSTTKPCMTFRDPHT